MFVSRLTDRAFWRITVQVHCLRLWYALANRVRLAGLGLRRLIAPLPAPGAPRPRRRGPVFAAPDPTLIPALRAQARLLGLALVAKVRPLVSLPRPHDRRLPWALGGYLLLAFALEYAFLAAFLPGSEPFAPAADTGADAAAMDPAYALEVGRTVAELTGAPMPGAARQLAPANLPPDCLPPGCLRRGEAALMDTVLADLGQAGMLPALPGLEPPGPEAEQDLASPSMVRMAVVRCQVRMPVDPLAFHPLDKESLMAVAGHVLPAMFARVQAADITPPEPEPTVLAQARPGPRAEPKAEAPEKAPRSLGHLAARFESGHRGVYAIGYDPKGGTSYGKYQMSSRKGTVAMFISYLDKRMPQWAERLRRAGRANTLCRSGAMPTAWRTLAQANPTLFETLQDDFIHRTFYSPTAAAVARTTGLDMAHRPAAVREVLLSTAVQHGPRAGANIVITAAKIAGKPTGLQFDRSLLKEIFKERERRIVQRALPSVRPALKRRLRDEMTLALAMLDDTAKESRLF